jgi:flagellar motor switch protein FliM
MPAANEQPEQPDVLSQSEVERLLAQVTEEETKVNILKRDEPENQEKASIQPYDFRHPAFLSAGELRRLRIRHGEFIRALAARLSIYLRLEFSLQLSNLDLIPYRKFVESLPNPAHLSLFKIEPLRGVGVLEIHPRLGLTIVDRLLGGPAHSITSDHDLSEIEVALMAQAVQLILGEWCNHWANIETLHPQLIGTETSGAFLQTASPDTVLLVLSMEAKLGDCLEQMQLAVPCHTLEPLIRKFAQVNGESPPSPPATVPLKWNKSFDDVKVPITAIWTGVKMTARDLTRLKIGDVVPLEPDCAQHVRIRLADLAKFEGRLGTTGGKWAVSLTSVLKPPPSF